MQIHTHYKTVGDIKGTNAMRFQAGTDGVSVAEELLMNHTPEAPVVDLDGRYLGFVSEKDLLKALMAGRNLEKLQAEDLMTRTVPFVNESLAIETAGLLMAERHLMNLPVVRDGILISTVTRHDLLRVLMDAGLGIEQ